MVEFIENSHKISDEDYILLEWFSNADKTGVFYCKIINGS